MALSLIYMLIMKGNCGSLSDLTDVLIVIICSIASIFKVLLPRINKKKMIIVINSTIDDWEKITDKKSRRKMEYFSKIGRILSIILVSSTYTCIFQLIFFGPLFSALEFYKANNSYNNYKNETFRVIPVGPNCWISDQSTSISFFNYAIIYICQSIQSLLLSNFTTCDIFFFDLSYHMCGQLIILQDSIGKINNTENKFEQKKIISQFIKRHNHLLKMINYFEDTYNILILVEVASIVLLTTISGNVYANIKLKIRNYLNLNSFIDIIFFVTSFHGNQI